MDESNPLQAAQSAADRCLALAADLGSLVAAKGNAAEHAHFEQLLSSLDEVRAELEAGRQLLAEQAAQIRQLAVVAMNSTTRSF
jgi:hypothetical protein